eukprot:10514794-Karenia_brevis.AAC.1
MLHHIAPEDRHTTHTTPCSRASAGHTLALASLGEHPEDKDPQFATFIAIHGNYFFTQIYRDMGCYKRFEVPGSPLELRMHYDRQQLVIQSSRRTGLQHLKSAFENTCSRWVVSREHAGLQHLKSAFDIMCSRVCAGSSRAHALGRDTYLQN